MSQAAQLKLTPLSDGALENTTTMSKYYDSRMLVLQLTPDHSTW